MAFNKIQVQDSGRSITYSVDETTQQIMTAHWDAEALRQVRAGHIWEALSSPQNSPKERAAPCHEKMKGAERPYAQEMIAHWEKAKNLGLVGEMDRIEKQILKRDILEMTQGASYPLVRDKDLEALFDFPRLRRKMWWHNFKSHLPFTRETEAITLRLQKDSIERAGVPIPYGAMLRYEEAKQAKIFTHFKVVYPNVITESELAAERAREEDPAIVGCYGDFMFLICSWDLPKDVAQAEATIADLLATKIKA